MEADMFLLKFLAHKVMIFSSTSVIECNTVGWFIVFYETKELPRYITKTSCGSRVIRKVAQSKSLYPCNCKGECLLKIKPILSNLLLYFKTWCAAFKLSNVVLFIVWDRRFAEN